MFTLQRAQIDNYAHSLYIYTHSKHRDIVCSVALERERERGRFESGAVISTERGVGENAQTCSAVVDVRVIEVVCSDVQRLATAVLELEADNATADR